MLACKGEGATTRFVICGTILCSPKVSKPRAGPTDGITGLIGSVGVGVGVVDCASVLREVAGVELLL